MRSTATENFRLNLLRFLDANPDTRPATLSVQAGKSKDYIRMLLGKPDQSPTLDTAEKIANQIGCSLAHMIAPPSDEILTSELIEGFSQLDERGQSQVLALIRADLAQIHGHEEPR